jgi:hypothetical protein
MTPFMPRVIVRGRVAAMADEGERPVQPDPPVIEGEDEVPRQPRAPGTYTPEPGPRPGERRAFRALWWAWLVVAVAVAVLLWALLR